MLILRDQLGVRSLGFISLKYVALKILRGADKSSGEYSSNEELFLRMLMQGRDRGGSGRRNIIELFDAFGIESANGVHRCLIMELAGLDFASLAVAMNYGFDDVVYLFKKCVETVECLHSLGISHGGTYIPLLGMQTGD